MRSAAQITCVPPLDAGNTTIVSRMPAVKVSEQWAAKLGNLPLAFIHKQRDHSSEPCQAHGIIGDVAAATAWSSATWSATAGTICSRAHPERIPAKSVTLVAPPWPALRPGGALCLTAARGNRVYGHRADSRREAPAEYDRCRAAAGRGYSLRVRGRFPWRFCSGGLPDAVAISMRD